MPGMTVKDMARLEFFGALDAYRDALRSGEGIAAASLAVHRAAGGVPRSYRSMISEAYRSCRRQPSKKMATAPRARAR